MTADTLVQVRNLCVAYRHDRGWLRVVDDVNFSISRGEAFGLVGESGCGKSTVAYHLLGYQRPNSRVEQGQVIFDGTDILSLDRSALDRLRGNRISLVPQNPTTALSPGMRVGRQIAETLTLHRPDLGTEATTSRVSELFGLVGLPQPDSIGRRYPHELSGGQQQRVVIAMALACDPDLVVLDEPTTGLDVTTQEQIIALLKHLRTRIGLSMLYVTHDLGVLSEIADRVGVMYAGAMVEVAATDTLFTQPRHPYTSGLIASIPHIEDGGRTTTRPLRGLLRRDELPKGCPFQPRCDFAEPSCASQRQHLAEVAPRHQVACQRWETLAAPAAATSSDPASTAPSKASALLVLDNITLTYTSNSWLAMFQARPAGVVNDLSFEIERGEVFALVGESGSGKSTVARAISGLLRPQTGQIVFDETVLPASIKDRPAEIRRRIQYIFQNPDASLNPRLRIGRIVGRPLQMFRPLSRGEIADQVAAVLRDVRIDADYAARFPDQLSGGERQRVAIARALIAAPDLLICDEILSALDVSVQANVLGLLRRLREEHHLAMLFISHDLAVVRGLADRVGVLFRGQLMEIGRVAEVFAPPFHPYTHSLLMAVPGQRAKYPGSHDLEAAGSQRPVGVGCAFAGRCAWQAGRACEEMPPPWQETSDGLRIRCHLSLDELIRRAVWRPQAKPPNQRSQIPDGRAMPA